MSSQDAQPTFRCQCLRRLRGRDLVEVDGRRPAAYLRTLRADLGSNLWLCADCGAMRSKDIAVCALCGCAETVPVDFDLSADAPTTKRESMR